MVARLYTSVSEVVDWGISCESRELYRAGAEPENDDEVEDIAGVGVVEEAELTVRSPSVDDGGMLLDEPKVEVTGLV